MTDAATLNRTVEVGPLSIANDRPFVLIAGPCALESRAHALETSHALIELTRKLGIGLIYKSSFDKANRTSLGSARGLGLETSLPILAEVRETWGCPVLTDIHLPEQCGPVAEAVDVLQIPAFLSRQTDLLVAAAKTGKVVNVKKGQFLAPLDMRHPIAKVRESGNARVFVTERGFTFGYHNLVVDMRAFPMIRSLGVPVVFDVTHSLQLPGGLGKATGGQSEYIEDFARAGVACGVDAVFMEVHDNPAVAPSDGPNQLPLNRLEKLLRKLKQIHELVNSE